MNEPIVLSETTLRVIQLLAFPVAFLLGIGILLLLEAAWNAFNEWLKERWWRAYQMEQYGRIEYQNGVERIRGKPCHLAYVGRHGEQETL